MTSKIAVGKIVATATDTGWSQAYHAGGFTAVLSVGPSANAHEKPNLQTAGKKLLDTLVSEYFTLTTKDLATIKGAVEATITKVPEDVDASLVVAAVVKNILYVVVANAGKAFLKRKDKIGLLLEVTSEDTERIASVSGFLETDDLVLLQTLAFSDVIEKEELLTSFDHKNPEELAEYYAPKIHNSDNGQAAALIFAYHEESPSPMEEGISEQPKEEPSSQLPGFAPSSVSREKKIFSHQQMIFLTIAVVLAIVLIGSIVIFQQRQEAAKQQQSFQALFAPAKAKYDEGEGLLQLNKSLAISDFQTAQSMLQSGENTFPASSSYTKQIKMLLSKVSQSLRDAKKVPLIQANKAPSNASSLLTFTAKHEGTYTAQDDTYFYTADSTGITQYNKNTNASKLIIKNTSDWQNLGGFATYLGNMYVLDTKDGIDKYVGASSGFGNKTAYFSGTTPDISKAVSIAIDGSIWILTSDGSIAKYTKGSPDTFALSGLDQGLKNPTEILTTVDFTNVYILDKGNSRVVVVKKDGSFVAQYNSDTVKITDAIDVSEKDKKLYLLSSGTIYQMDLK